MTIQDLKDRDLLLFEAISGSTAYGTNLPSSDQDIRGVFVQPQTAFFSLSYQDQVNDKMNDIVFYELRRFAELLSTCNPNMLELLAMPEDCVLYKHPLFDRFQPELFLSKLCKQTFAGYAMTQIRKARGLNKKIMQPMKKERKEVLDFCHIAFGQGSVPLKTWLKRNSLMQEHCGLVNIPHMHNVYALFYDPSAELGFKGVTQKTTSNMVSLSSIPKGMERLAIMAFNKDGYTAYCKSYREYWEWVEKRNEARYENTVSHGKNYDAKNMLHTFRLLDMAEDIATKGEIIVRRPNREFLLEIRRGDFDYLDLVAQAEEKVIRIDELYANSNLPDRPDKEAINEILVEIRGEWYSKRKENRTDFAV